MSFLADHLLSLIILVPLLGAIVALSFPAREPSGVRGFAIAVALVDLVLVIWLWSRFDPAASGLQLRETVAWVPSFGIQYAVGIDGVALVLVALTAFLGPLVLAGSDAITPRRRDYVVCLLLLQAAMLAAFLAADLFLFYVAWELLLVPMVFLIGVWGGNRRIYAAVKFFLYTMVGSLLMLVAILSTVWAVREPGGITFDYTEIAKRLGDAAQTARLVDGAQAWLFLAFAFAFAIKVPLFPLHTWLPDAHVEAPTGGSVILAGVLLKLGTFGLLRYAFGLFPGAALQFVPALGLLAVIGILYGALAAWVQSDLKRLVAYSSVSHLGFVVLGLCAWTVTGLTGGVLQMVNHGISTAALFLLVGVIYDRRHTRQIADFGGLAKVMPAYAVVWVIMTMSSIGVPGLNGFVGEFMILVGTFRSTGVQLGTTGEIAWLGIAGVMLAALSGIVLTGVALLRADRETVGPWTARLTLLGVCVAAFALAAPPWGEFAGGILVRPLAGLRDAPEAFGEVLATLAVLAALGVIVAAVYLLTATQKVFFGPVKHRANLGLHDLTPRERLVLAPLVVAAVVLGVYPKPLLDVIEPTVAQATLDLRTRAGVAREGTQTATPSPGPGGPRVLPQGAMPLVPLPQSPVVRERPPRGPSERMRLLAPPLPPGLRRPPIPAGGSGPAGPRRQDRRERPRREGATP